MSIPAHLSYDVVPEPPEPREWPVIKTPRERAREIIAEVAAAHELTADDLMKKTHKRKYAWPRHEAFTQLRERMGLSYPQIAEIFACHHTSVMHGIAAHTMRQRGKRFYKSGLSFAEAIHAR